MFQIKNSEAVKEKLMNLTKLFNKFGLKNWEIYMQGNRSFLEFWLTKKNDQGRQ